MKAIGRTRQQRFATELRRWTVWFSLLLAPVAWPIFAWNLGNNSLHFVVSLAVTALFSLALFLSGSSIRGLWVRLRTKTETIRLRLAGAKGAKRLKTVLKYIGLALLIVGANWVAGNPTVSNILTGPIWVRVVLGVVVTLVPLALAFRGERGRRYFVAYVGLIVAMLIFLIGKINDIITGAIPALFGPGPTNLVLVIIYVLLVAFLLFQIDYWKEVPKIVKTQLEKKGKEDVNKRQ